MDWDLYFLINPDTAAAAGPGVMLSWDGPSPAHPNNNTARSSPPHLATHHHPLRHPRQHPMLRGGQAEQEAASLCWVTLPGLGAVMALSPQQLSAQPHHRRDIREILLKHLAQYLSSLSL